MSVLPALNVNRPKRLITQCPEYSPTPLKEIGIQGIRILVKDESNRFGLGAFKALGGVYAVAAFLLDQWAVENQIELSPDKLFLEEVRAWASQYTFVCASAGNHGMAVAKGAQLFGARSRVYLAETVPESFARKLADINAEIVRSGSTYEESMSAAQEDCAGGDKKTVLLADSSWPGYLALPTLVMEGYTVLAEELRQNFTREGQWPTHVFLQAGVGGLAAAVAYYIRENWDVQPEIIVVEPDAAPCLYESNRRGKLTSVEGPVSAMGRLDCKEASLLAFSILQKCADKFVCISEQEAENAVSTMRAEGIETTPSGAAGVAAILAAQRLELDIEGDSLCLGIITEGLV